MGLGLGLGFGTHRREGEVEGAVGVVAEVQPVQT